MANAGGPPPPPLFSSNPVASSSRSRVLPASSSAPALAADSVDRLIIAAAEDKRHLLHESAREERLREQQFRLNQRTQLNASRDAERDRYQRELGTALHARRQRSAARIKESPLNAKPLEDQERAERLRESTEYHDEIVADSLFKSTMNLTFTKRVMIGDPFAELRAESRELLEQRRRLKAHMQAERTRMRMEGADRRRPNNTEEFYAKRRTREEETRLKEEFYRSLTGWDGKKLKARTKPVKELWEEYKANALPTLPALLPATESGTASPKDVGLQLPSASPTCGSGDDAGFVFVPEAGLGAAPVRA